jgi:hypothetical protein
VADHAKAADLHRVALVRRLLIQDSWGNRGLDCSEGRDNPDSTVSAGEAAASGRQKPLPQPSVDEPAPGGRLVAVITGARVRLPLAICGLCSALVAVDEDGELWHAHFRA